MAACSFVLWKRTLNCIAFPHLTRCCAVLCCLLCARIISCVWMSTCRANFCSLALRRRNSREWQQPQPRDWALCVPHTHTNIRTLGALFEFCNRNSSFWVLLLRSVSEREEREPTNRVTRRVIVSNPRHSTRTREVTQQNGHQLRR